MDDLDRRMMQRCIALSVRSGEEGEYPYGVVVCRDGAVVAESINRVAHERDVTRHAEVVALSQAQKALGTVCLDDCAIDVSAEPCAICSLAIRETRTGRVVYALRSPHMVVRAARRRGAWQGALAFLRCTVFDRFGRG